MLTLVGVRWLLMVISVPLNFSFYLRQLVLTTELCTEVKWKETSSKRAYIPLNLKRLVILMLGAVNYDKFLEMRE